MVTPKITFFSELDKNQLGNVFTEQTLSDLVEMKASISLGILDFSSERAELVKRLNQAGIPVIAWLLLPKSEGYWFNLGNAPQACDRYDEFLDWTQARALVWDGVGLDIEPDIRDFLQLREDRKQILPEIIRRLFNIRRLRSGQQAYKKLAQKIHDDTYRLDSYQFPLITDERKACSTILQRLSGIVDLPVDREVWMLYSSFVRPHGAGCIASYAAEAQSVGLGSTGGGVELDIFPHTPLTWQELARDLRLSWYYCQDIHIFSLEGCLEQGFFTRLKDFSWDTPILTPEESLTRVDNWRWLLRVVLWFASHFCMVFLVSASLFFYRYLLRRFIRR